MPHPDCVAENSDWPLRLPKSPKQSHMLQSETEEEGIGRFEESPQQQRQLAEASLHSCMHGPVSISTLR